MAKYHVNPQGNAGKCRAFSGQCPFGDAAKHYDSMEEAQQAYETTMGDAVPTPAKPVAKMSPRVAVKVAASSSDPDDLMAAAKSLGNLSLSRRKTALALALNPASTEEVLTTARSLTNLSYTEFVQLEQHPNYPLSAMTGAGAYMRLRNCDEAETLALLQQDEVGDELFSQTEMGSKSYSHEAARLALANPRNHIAPRTIAHAADNDRAYAVAAAQSGRFPTEADLSGKTHVYHRDQVRTLPNGWATEEGPVRDEAIILAAAHNPDNQRLQAIYERYKHTDQVLPAAKAILSNPHTSEDTKNIIRQDLRTITDELSDFVAAADSK